MNIESGVIVTEARVDRAGRRWRVTLRLPAWIAKEMYAEMEGHPILRGLWLEKRAHYTGMQITDHIELEFCSPVAEILPEERGAKP